jgi:Nif-specific regulatory protein
VYERTDRAARTDATVLVRGPSGSGKELIARAIHDNSPRRDAPFVKVDCAALPETLIENELFGHERGAFTGADRPADGKVQAAEGGTLFLDEIGELPMAVQGRLLRLVQDRTFHRVGGTRAIPADVRFVCATHRDLLGSASFRQDLYYRIRVVEIRVPALRERGHGELERLIDHFLFEHARKHRRPGMRLRPEARERLHAWSWPGNVRELEHCIEAAVVLAPGTEIGTEHLDLPGVAPAAQAFSGALGTLAEVEAAYVRHVLEACGGNRSAAARILGIGRNTLARKLGG